jgi:hypothetical protein
MRTRMLKNNPVMKRLGEIGEERIGKIAQQLLSNDRFVTAIQGLISKTVAAKGTLDKSLKSALAAMNLPSSEDLDALRSKVEDLERLLGSVETKIDALLTKDK